MKGSVKVVGKTTPVGSAKLDALRVRNQTAAALKVAKGLVKATKPAANTVSVGAEGKGGVSYFGMLPEKLTVASRDDGHVRDAGEARRTSIRRRSGPGGTDEKSFAKSYLGTIAEELRGHRFDQPRRCIPSDLPTAAPAGADADAARQRLLEQRRAGRARGDRAASRRTR